MKATRGFSLAVTVSALRCRFSGAAQTVVGKFTDDATDYRVPTIAAAFVLVTHTEAKLTHILTPHAQKKAVLHSSLLVGW